MMGDSGTGRIGDGGCRGWGRSDTGKPGDEEDREPGQLRTENSGKEKVRGEENRTRGKMNEKLSGHQLGTTVIFDLEGLSTDMLSRSAIKMITSMLSQLQVCSRYFEAVE
ncbi:unnamed protein product [Anisakis simplex]|uniref:Midasin n=1 Tax=Anisakis simplex TaxID=6269 RepID=A0A0M3JJ75_ANISI|nr:unnamed protein product [Anisakis simplex]